MFYSQCGEDIHLLKNYFENRKNGIYFEAGALDGVKYSNTKFFEDTMGWNGILVEPNPTQFNLLKSYRGNNTKNKLFNSLISNSKEEVEFIYSDYHHSAVSGVLSTIPETHHSEYFQYVPTHIIKLKPKSLDTIFKEAGFKEINLFILDVEGHEINVLKSFSFDIPIEIMMIENLDMNNSNKVGEIRNYLKDKDFEFVETFKHNEIYRNLNFVKK
jgi:FkbM family methyltransferase